MEIVENGAAVALDVTPAQAVALVEASAHWRKTLKLREEPLRVIPARAGKFLIEARGVAGFIRVGEISLEIAPKFLNPETCGPSWRAAMWRFLAYGHGIEALSEASGKDAVEEGIADVLAELFLTSLRGASARGYPLRYKTSRFSTPFLKGRLDPKSYGKLVPVSGYVDVIASQLSPDIPTNRLLKWAGIELAANVEDPGRRRRLLAWASDLQGVRPWPPRSAQVPSPHRHHPYLVHAVEIAKLLLEDREVGYEEGEFNLPGFLWDSEDLFERAARRLLSEASRRLGLAASKERHALARTNCSGEEVLTHTTPDITVRSRTKTVLLADAKYKVPGTHPSNADFYQVLAAGRVTGVSNVALLYPAQGSDISSKRYEPKGSGLPTTVSIARIGLEAFSSRGGIRALRDQAQTLLNAWVNKGP